MKRGSRFKTNDKFEELLREMGDTIIVASLPWYGEVMGSHDPIPGCKIVMFDNIPIVQFVSEDYLEPHR